MSNCKVIALTNQKGGVGKTTTAVNLGVSLVQQGKKVLLIDADAQANLTMALGYNRPDDIPITLSTVMQNIIDDKSFDVSQGIIHHSEGVDLLPSNIELSGFEVRLINAMSRERVLKTYVNEVKKNYDYVLIDCMPSLGMITINALAAADSVIIPTQPHYLSAKGFGSNYANSGARAVYDQIVAMLREHNTIPSFMSGGKNDITKELAYKDGKYSITLTDSNGVLSDYSFSSSDSNVSVSKSGNKLTISSTVAISGSVRITAKRNNVPTVSSSAKLIAYGDPNLQDLVTGVENADTVSAYINIETPTGTIALKKTSEDGVVEGISFTIKGDNFNKTVKTGKDGSVSVEGLLPDTYTVTEQSIDRYEPQKTQTVTLIGGKTSTVTFSNTLKRGSLEIVKTSEDNLVEGMKFHLYGTSLSGLPVDEYAVTDKNGLAKFENVLISGDTPYVVEEVDTVVRYVVPASQTAPIEWNKVTKRSFDNVLKKFQVTVTKTDAETGSPQGDASLAGAVYSIYKGEELIDTYTTDENGQFTTKYYICDNDWTVREISPSEGYLLDTAIHKVGAEPELYTVELNSTASSSYLHSVT